MAFLLILDREHKALWVKTKNKPKEKHWLLPEVEDPVNKPSNRLNVELLAKQAFIPLKSSLIGKKKLSDISKNDQILYLFLCPGKEASEILFDLTKYRDIQWFPMNTINESDYFSGISGKSILEAYYDILMDGFTIQRGCFHIVKNGHGKKEIDQCNRFILEGEKRMMIELKDQYTLNHQPIPKIGDYAFLNNWKGIPIAVLEMIDVIMEPFEKIRDTLQTINCISDQSVDVLEKQYYKIFSKWSKDHNQKFSKNKQVIFSQFKITRHFKERNIDHLKIP